MRFIPFNRVFSYSRRCRDAQAGLKTKKHAQMSKTKKPAQAGGIKDKKACPCGQANCVLLLDHLFDQGFDACIDPSL